jgi:hypothetical protein
VEFTTLTATTGTWTHAPTSYTPQWQRCSARGTACVAIAGATEQRRRLISADVGHRLRVQELAANQAGYGPLQYSKLTARVASRPAPPQVSRPSLSDPRPSRAALAFSLTAARYGPKLHTLVITLPTGVRFATKTRRGHPLRGLGVSSHGHRLRAMARTVAHRLRITLAHTVTSVRIVLRAPSLTLAGPLSHRLHARRVTELTLHVMLSGPGSHNLRTTKRWKAR